MMGDMTPGDLVQKITELETERDEARGSATQLHQKLFDLLARIHRDGGQYTDEVGVETSLALADEIVCKLYTRNDVVVVTIAKALLAAISFAEDAYDNLGTILREDYAEQIVLAKRVISND